MKSPTEILAAIAALWSRLSSAIGRGQAVADIPSADVAVLPQLPGCLQVCARVMVFWALRVLRHHA